VGFALDHRLEESSFFIEDWDLCRVSLKSDATWPWLYLVPRRDNIREIYDLNAEDQAQLMREISFAARALQACYGAEKINIAALGNMVPQLHVHVFARFKADPAWPRPVWAVQHSEIAYTESQVKEELERLKGRFASMRP
jgi:diadenosine tetraphosphate (Ap4A) HIT family hydrolase